MADNASSTENIAQLVKLLYDRGIIKDEQAASKALSEQWGRELNDRSNATSATVDTYSKLAQTLASQMSASPGLDEAALTNRRAQILSGKNAQIDRAGAIASSQGYAQALKRGMGDSTQAEDQATQTARKLADYYMVADNDALTAALNEQLGKQKMLATNMQVAGNGLAQLNGQALSNARSMQQSASGAASKANAASGSNLQDLLSTSLSKAAMGAVDYYRKDNSGGSLYDALKKGLGFGGEDASANPQKVAVGDQSYDLSGNSENVFEDNGWSWPKSASSAGTEQTSENTVTQDDTQVAGGGNFWEDFSWA